MCDIPRVVKICKLVHSRHRVGKIFLAVMASERNKRRSGKFFVTGGPVLASYKTPLTRKVLHLVSDLFGYSGLTTKRRMRPCYVPSIANKVAIDGFKTVEILYNGDV